MKRRKDPSIMGDDVFKLKTDNVLLERLKMAAEVKQTPADRLEQRVSFIFSSINPENGVTRERIRQALVEQEGGTAA